MILLDSFDSFQAKVMNDLLVRVATIMGLVVLASQECEQQYVDTRKAISYIKSYVDTRKAISHIDYTLACISTTTKFQFYQTTPIKSAIKSIPISMELSIFKVKPLRQSVIIQVIILDFFLLYLFGNIISKAKLG